MKNIFMKLKWLCCLYAVIGRAFCKHKYEKIGIDYEYMYRDHYYGMVAKHKCCKCGKESVRTTSRVYVRLPYL